MWPDYDAEDLPYECPIRGCTGWLDTPELPEGIEEESEGKPGDVTYLSCRKCGYVDPHSVKARADRTGSPR